MRAVSIFWYNLSMSGNHEKPNWDETFLVQAWWLSNRGSCDRLRTACVLVNKDKHVVGTGYNGSVSGLETCDEAGHLLENNHCVRTLHGEVNAVLNSVREDLRGATAYIVGTPCVDCSKVLMQKGIARVVTAGTYSNAKAREATMQMFAQKGVKFEEWPGGAEAILKVLGRGIKRSRSAGGLFKDIPHEKFGEHLNPPSGLV